jgi:tetratricopeptide (TPR) repeat protein
VRVTGLVDESHTFVSALHARDQLVPLFAELIDGRLPSFCDSPGLDPADDEIVVDSVLAFHRREYEAAAAQIVPLAAAKPEWSGAHFLLGKALFYAGDAAGAERAHAAAVAANPGWFEPYRHLGQAQLAQGRAAEAESPLRRAAEMNPAWAQAHFYLGECLRELGREDEARAALERAVEVDTGWGEPRARLEELYGDAQP